MFWFWLISHPPSFSKSKLFKSGVGVGVFVGRAVGVRVDVGGLGMIVKVETAVSVGVAMTAGAQETEMITGKMMKRVLVFIAPRLSKLPPNGLRYLLVGGRG